MDIGRVIDLYDSWKIVLPNVQPFYAVKCNQDPVLLKILASLGTGFDCAGKVREVLWYHRKKFKYYINITSIISIYYIARD